MAVRIKTNAVSRLFRAVLRARAPSRLPHRSIDSCPTSGWCAPGDQPTGTGLKFLLRGPDWRGSTAGYSSCLRDFFSSFQRLGIDVWYQYFRADGPRHRELEKHFAQSRGLQGKYWQSTQCRDFDAVFTFGQPREPDRVEHRRSFIYTFCETDSVPGRTKLYPRPPEDDWVRRFDNDGYLAILACSDATATAFRASGVRTRCWKLPWPQFALEECMNQERNGDGEEPKMFALYSKSSEQVSMRDIVRKHKCLYFSMGEIQPRKNFGDLVRAFHIAFGGVSEVGLLLKVSVGSLSTAKDVQSIRNELITYGHDLMGIRSFANVYFCADYVSWSQLAQVLSRVQFFFTTTHGEGLGGPIVQAMWSGVPCVGHRFSALGDYITDANSVIFKHDVAPVAGISSPAYDFGQNWATFRLVDIERALHRSFECYSKSPESYEQMATCARETVRQRYSQAAFRGNVGSLLKEFFT